MDCLYIGKDKGWIVIILVRVKDRLFIYCKGLRMECLYIGKDKRLIVYLLVRMKD